MTVVANFLLKFENLSCIFSKRLFIFHFQFDWRFNLKFSKQIEISYDYTSNIFEYTFRTFLDHCYRHGKFSTSSLKFVLEFFKKLLDFSFSIQLAYRLWIWYTSKRTYSLYVQKWINFLNRWVFSGDLFTVVKVNISHQLIPVVLAFSYKNHRRTVESSQHFTRILLTFPLNPFSSSEAESKKKRKKRKKKSKSEAKEKHEVSQTPYLFIPNIQINNTEANFVLT